MKIMDVSGCGPTNVDERAEESLEHKELQFTR
jgi:hypothetical protein